MMLGRLSAACSRRAIFTSSRPLLNEVRCTGGLVGYDVDPDVEAKLTALYTETLAELESIPESSEYREGPMSLIFCSHLVIGKPWLC